MKPLIKRSLFCLSVFAFPLTSCGEEGAEPSSHSTEKKEKLTPLTPEDAANEAFGAITAAKAYDVDWAKYPEEAKLSQISSTAEQAFRAAVKAHPDLAELIAHQKEEGIESVERFRRIGAVNIAAQKIPELAALGKTWHDANLARIKFMTECFEKEGKTELAQTIRGFIARVK